MTCFAEELLDMRFSHLLDDMEFIFKVGDRIQYLCLGQCLVMTITEAEKTTLDLVLEVAKYQDHKQVWLPPYSYEINEKIPFIRCSFNLQGRHYHLMFQILETGELPKDVTSFEHDYFYELRPKLLEK